MRKHLQTDIGLAEDEYSISVGLAGLVANQKNEVIIQVIKEPDPQDVKFGHEKIYLDYNGSGGYGLVREVVVSNSENPSISIHLNQRSAQEASISASELVFGFSGSVDIEATNMLKKVCEIANTPFRLI